MADKIATLVAQRQEARRSKSFDKADSIRKELTALGVEIKDLPMGLRNAVSGAIRRRSYFVIARLDRAYRKQNRQKNGFPLTRE